VIADRAFGLKVGELDDETGCNALLLVEVGEVVAFELSSAVIFFLFFFIWLVVDDDLELFLSWESCELEKERLNISNAEDIMDFDSLRVLFVC